MNVRAQMSMVFHLDKCIGCHTCSLACKNLWTSRPGTEYMWWNNVETKPGTGYPTLYEDQELYHGGWELKNGNLQLRLGSRPKELATLGHNPRLPTLDDYYEPWTYKYKDLFDAPLGDDQPVARPVSAITGRDIDIEAGPNWDDDLGGSEIYAANDPNLKKLTPEEQRQFFDLQQLVYFYLPRICNHCLNPSCVAACPAGAIYKRGEDGIVLISQEKCQGWRMCVSGCPYKKVYFNYQTGKAEKCILCYPRLENGIAPACFHTCPGRIRYLGVVLYDAEKIQWAASHPDNELVDAHRSIILDPYDPAIVAAAHENGINDKVIDCARRSPTFKYIKQWDLGLPLHPEWRTMPMLFYIPPLLPVLATVPNGAYEMSTDFFTSVESVRLPIKYLASLFTAGDEERIIKVYRKLIACRITMRASTVGDVSEEVAARAREEAGISREQVEGVYHLTSLANDDERYVIPPMMREQANAMLDDTKEYQEPLNAGARGNGTGFVQIGSRGL